MPIVKQKRIYQWRTLCRALEESREPQWLDHLSSHDRDTLALLRQRTASDVPVARLTRRLWAIGAPDCVRLAYLECRGGVRRVRHVAAVYPGAAGRTLYAIHQQSYGPAIAMHTPLTTAHRPDRGVVYAHGRDDVWQPGLCDYLPSAGPRCMHLTLRQACEAVQRDALARGIHRQGRAAVGFLRRLSRVMRRFTGVVTRYRSVVAGPVEFHGSDPSRTRLRSPYGVVVELLAPGRADASHIDLRLAVLGPLDGFAYATRVHYAICGWRADLRATAAPSQLQGTPLADMNWVAACDSARVIGLATEWAASKLQIPCT